MMKFSMVSALEANETVLGINVSADSYANFNTGKKHSVANFVLVHKGAGYQFESVVRNTFNAGLADETSRSRLRYNLLLILM